MSRVIFAFVFLASTAAYAQPPATPATPGNTQTYSYSAERLLGMMDEAERKYYYESFDYMMEKMRPGQTHAWKSYDSSGEFTPQGVFEGVQTVCRKFKERINIKSKVVTTLDGVGCKRLGKDGWCRLPDKENMRSCALEPPRSDLERAGRDVKDAVNGASRSASNAKSKLWGWWPF